MNIKEKVLKKVFGEFERVEFKGKKEKGKYYIRVLKGTWKGVIFDITSTEKAIDLTLAEVEKLFHPDNEKLVKDFIEKEWVKIYDKSNYPEKTFELWFARWAISRERGKK